MAIYKRFFPNLQSAFSISIMIAIWIAFAPTQVGGMASYIIVIGKSMEPKFHIGDLVIIHKQPNYQVGDAIVYRNLELENFVFHRIVSDQMGRYTLKGDNNTWVDTYKPSQEEVIGELWLYIPQAGTVIQKMRSPIGMALIAGIFGAVLAASLLRNKARGNKQMNNKTVQTWFTPINQKIRDLFRGTNKSDSQKSFFLNQGEVLEGLFFILGLMALSSLILGIIAFSRPTSRLALDEVTYQNLGVFSYSASTPQGVYDANTIKSGDPIFTKMACSIDVNFQYTLVAAQAEDVTGTYQLTAVVSDQLSGWQRVVPLQDQTVFKEGTFATNARLDLCNIESLIQSMEQKTDAHPSFYALMISPNVKLNGEVSKQALQADFNPALAFRYDRLQFYIVRGEEQNNPLAFTETGILNNEHKVPNTMILLGREITISMLRTIASSGLIASLAGLILLGLQLQTLSRLSQAKFFHIKYDSLLIDVQNVDSATSSGVIAVGSMDALAKLAERSGAMILHLEQTDAHEYYVQANGTTYKFVLTIEQLEPAARGDETIDPARTL